MKLRNLSFFLIILIFAINECFALLANVGDHFNLLIRKSGDTDCWFYEPPDINNESTSFRFTRNSEDTTTPATEDVGIAWTIYDSSISTITLEFTDNDTESFSGIDILPATVSRSCIRRRKDTSMASSVRFTAISA